MDIFNPTDLELDDYFEEVRTWLSLNHFGSREAAAQYYSTYPSISALLYLDCKRAYLHGTPASQQAADWFAARTQKFPWKGYRRKRIPLRKRNPIKAARLERRKEWRSAVI
jgi:hypothetical protein